MREKSSLGVTRTLFCWALPVFLIGIYIIDKPFSKALVTRSVSLSALSSEQRLNIESASRRLDGLVIKPNEEFSFNRTVGPRTIFRGYLLAPSYVGKDAPQTVGGGICLLSSAVYDSALNAGLTIKERSAHLRTIHSVPAGLDATVWYGRSDLRFINNLDCPIEIHTTYEPNEVTVELLGTTHLPNWKQCQVSTVEHKCPENLLVDVFSRHDGKTVLISHDSYALSYPSVRGAQPR